MKYKIVLAAVTVCTLAVVAVMIASFVGSVLQPLTKIF